MRTLLIRDADCIATFDHADPGQALHHHRGAAAGVGQAGEADALCLQPLDELDGTGQRVRVMKQRSVQIEEHRRIGREVKGHER